MLQWIQSRPWRFYTTSGLRRVGANVHGDTTGMAVRIADVQDEAAAPAGLVIKKIAHKETLKIQRTIEMQGFGSSEEEAHIYYVTHSTLRFGDGTPWHYYIGWRQHEPVAMATLFLHAGVAGIYGIATIPELRRQGIAAAMTQHALREARARGYQVAVLSPTKLSIGIYRRLGFQEYCRLRHYAWSPTTS